MAAMYRTQGTATDRKKFTVSMWVKIAKIGSEKTAYQFMDFYASGSDRISLYHNPTDYLQIYHEKANSGSNEVAWISDAIIRDKTAWYHFVWRADSTQATAADRFRVYINGQLITLNSTTYPSQNFEFAQGTSSYVQYVGRYGGNTNNNFEGVMSHVNFCDGYSYGPDSFGSTDATTGIWKINTSPSVTYGNNGFFLKMEDTSNLDLDSSPNAHTFTTGGGTVTATKDCPSNNFATLNPLLQNNTATTYSNGNTKGTGTSSTSNFSSTPATLAASVGKWYAEYKPNLSSTDSSISGFVNLDTANFNATDYYGGSNNMSAGLYDSGGQILHSTGTNLGSVGALSNGDIVMLAMDLDNGYLYWGKNGTWFNSANPATSGGTGGLALSNLGSNGTYTFLNGNRKSMGTEWNFGSGFFGTTAVASANADGNGIGAFEYSVPSGYYALCTKNIKEFGG